ncbi:unnamed protein product [Rotaria sp. Silwood2]|nr:unnamed protein product [Rotaria sp. Silwood2]CAF3982602.1 unnamed protein product [Rotaria sp. Silwood2]
MFGFQTLVCLHDIPIIRSSTNKLQDVYTKAKNTSPLIRLPCNLVEIVADKSLKIASTVVNPFVKPLRGPIRVIDNFTVETIHQIEANYPAIHTLTKEVRNRLNEKTERVRHVMNSVKDTTTSTIQHGKEIVSNVAAATVNIVTNVADTVYTFCETHVPGKTVPVHGHDFGGRTTLLWNRLTSSVGLNIDQVMEPIQRLLIWYRMLIVSCLLKILQKNDIVLHKIQRKRFLFVLPQRILSLTGNMVEYIIERIRPDDKRETKEQSQLMQQKRQQFISRQTLKPGAFVITRQTARLTKQGTAITRDENGKSPVIESVSNDDIGILHDRLKPTDYEFLYSRVPADVTSSLNNQEFLAEDQLMIHTKSD